MRKALIIALGLVSLGAIASVQPAFSLTSQPWAAACRIQNIQCNKNGSKVCANTYINCMQPTVQLGGGASGPGPAPDVSTRRNIRPN
ncbi:MAG TPA: hypothetical protein VHQ92_03765 [Pseudolabrys sp.]|jgi:hypothetical protein|nr:hypothetical protein [Pseudolabrys sp.]